MRPSENVKCYARCVIERCGYYYYDLQQFDVERLVELSAAVLHVPVNTTLVFAIRCVRDAWEGIEDCNDFWQLYRCFKGSV